MLGNGEIVLRLLIASALGSAIGIERERLLWAAGLRTHMLVCVGSCLIIIVSAYGFSDALVNEHTTLDPSRIAAQVVSGIGFLGAGTILFRGEAVRGLTTAASLWAVAAIGLTVGAGLLVAGLAATVIVLVILAGIKPLEERYRARSHVRRLQLLVEHDRFSIDTLREAAGPLARRVQQFVLKQGGADRPDEVDITFSRMTDAAFARIVAKLREHPSVAEVETGDPS